MKQLNDYSTPEEIFQELPLVVRSYLIFKGVTPIGNFKVDFDEVYRGLEKLSRNNPLIIDECEKFFNSL